MGNVKSSQVDDFVDGKQHGTDKMVVSAGSALGLDNYTIIKTIGTGSSAVVKLAQRKGTGEKVAIKIIDRRTLDHLGLKRVGQEISVWENLEHPGIIQLYEVIVTDRYFCFVCEYAARGDLLEHVRANGRLKGETAKRLCAQLVAAVDYCHSQGVVHRDLKLENVLLDSHGNAKIADWGFGRFYPVDASSRIKEWCGSPPYAAPEIFLGKPYVGPDIDIWSLGVVMYGVVTGKLPFDSETFDGVCAKVISGMFTVPYFMSLECEHLVRGMLSKNLARRFCIQQIKMHVWLEFPRLSVPLGDYTPVPRPRPRQPCLLGAVGSHQKWSGDAGNTWAGVKPRATKPGQNRPRSNTCMINQKKKYAAYGVSVTPVKTRKRSGSLYNPKGGQIETITEAARPASCVPKCESPTPLSSSKEETPKKLHKAVSHRPTAFNSLSRRLFRVINPSLKDKEGEGLATPLDLIDEATKIDGPIQKSDSNSSRKSLPARIEDTRRATPPPDAPENSEAAPKPRFPCVECHRPATAWWNFSKQSPTKCLDCKDKEKFDLLFSKDHTHASSELGVTKIAA